MKTILQNIARAKSANRKILADFQKNPPAFCDLLADDFSKIQKFSAANKKWRQVLIVGIGGSSLPARTLVDALGKSQHEFYFLENVDPSAAAKIFARIDWSKVLVLIVSKSGDTLETLANFFVVRKLLGKNWRQQTVFLTDAQKGFLRELAIKENIPTFEIPAKVGGRFSIFSPVGLLPAALAGANLTKLLNGARKADPKQALAFAQMHATEFQRGKNIAVFCVYANALESLAKFFEQLLAESLGKNARVGITPASAVGALDQHSKLQLWRDGPNDKFYIFVGAQKFKQDFLIPNPPPEFSFLQKRNLSEILRAEFLATTQSLAEKKRPLAIFDFAEIKEVELGEFLQFLMLEVYFLAQILDVNFANQPGVERGKILAREQLGAN